MALFTTDLSGEISQIKTAADDIIRESVNPALEKCIQQASGEINNMIDKVIGQASAELIQVIEHAGGQIERSALMVSNEIHSQRQVTAQELKDLIDYAASKLDKTIERRFQQIRLESAHFIEERVEHLKAELNDTAVRSRRMLYINLGLSVATALGMAIIGLIYKKISLGEVDPYAAFRVMLLAAASGTGVFSLLRTAQSWMGMNQNKKKMAAVVIEQAALLRPNGAFTYFVLTIALISAWYAVVIYY